jgi:hypothetical protein
VRGRENGSFSELSEEWLSLGRVLIFCDGVGSWLKKSIRYQPVDGLSFICLQIICGPFPAPSTHEVAEDGEFFVADGEGFCHFTASLGKSNRPHRSEGPLRLGSKVRGSLGHFDCRSEGSAIA